MLIQSYHALIELLREEDSIYREMADLLEEERSALAKMAVERLGEITSRKETLTLRIKALDESRKMLARRLGEALELPAEQVTITRLSQRAPVPLGAELKSAGDSLRHSVGQCQKLNQLNSIAARRGWDLANGMIAQLIEGADPAGRLYQAPGGAKGYASSRGGGSGFVSRQA